MVDLKLNDRQAESERRWEGGREGEEARLREEKITISSIFHCKRKKKKLENIERKVVFHRVCLAVGTRKVTSFCFFVVFFWLKTAARCCCK